jgi:hypothetical protein
MERGTSRAAAGRPPQHASESQLPGCNRCRCGPGRAVHWSHAESGFYCFIWAGIIILLLAVIVQMFEPILRELTIEILGNYH